MCVLTDVGASRRKSFPAELSMDRDEIFKTGILAKAYQIV